MKFKYFYKRDHNKQPIPGSNVRRKTKPGNQWMEIPSLCCDSPDEIDCTCGARFFVQLDGRGKPVDGSLIKRFGWPQMSEGIKYQEIDWKSVCCVNQMDFNYDISFPDENVEPLGLLYKNGVLQATADGPTGVTGTFKVVAGDEVRFVVTSNNNCSSFDLMWDVDSTGLGDFGNLDQTFTIVDSTTPYELTATLVQGTCGE